MRAAVLDGLEPAGLTTAIARDLGELTTLETEWWALWERCPSATPFQSPAWLIPWWRQFAPGRLATIAVRRDGRLVGLAPFYLEAGSKRLMPVGISVSDFLDVLIEPKEAAAIAAAITAAAESLPWTVWSLEELAPDAAAWILPRPAGAREVVAEQSLCPVLPIPDGDWTSAVPARRRRLLRSSEKAAARLGDVEITDAHHMPEAFLDHLFRLHRARWQDRGEPGVLDDPLVQRFHREALPALAARRLARCATMTIGGSVAGAHYGFADARHAYYYIGGFDPRFASASPGSVLIGKFIAWAAGDGLREVHFLRGAEAYKYAWGASDRPNRRRLWERGA